jgi:hypothetical protein
MFAKVRVENRNPTWLGADEIWVKKKTCGIGKPCDPERGVRGLYKAGGKRAGSVKGRNGNSCTVLV